MEHINADTHPGLHRYSLEIRRYPELTEEQYASVIADLKQPEGSDAYQNAREKLICSHLGMVLAMAIHTIHRYYGLSMEDFVGIGNLALVECFDGFDSDKGVKFASYMKKVIVRCEYANVKLHVTWERDEDVDVESIGVMDSFPTETVYDSLYRALDELTESEMEIIRYSFFDEFEPDDRQIARKLRISKNYLVETRRGILEKLRRRLKSCRYCSDQRYYVETNNRVGEP